MTERHLKVTREAIQPVKAINLSSVYVLWNIRKQNSWNLVIFVLESIFKTTLTVNAENLRLCEEGMRKSAADPDLELIMLSQGLSCDLFSNHALAEMFAS